MGEDNLTSAGMSMTEEQQSMPLRDAVFMSNPATGSRK